MIDEKKLIEAIVNTPTEESGYNPVYLNGCATRQFEIIDIIDKQPKVGEWIPCSERLPEKDGTYLCSCDWSIGSFVCVRKFAKDLHSIQKYDFPKGSGAGFYYYEEDWGYSKETDVIAWQPLPEPYKGVD